MPQSVARGTLLRIFVVESDRYHGKPLYQAIVETLRDEHLSGATVLKGVEGYGSSGTVHSSRTVDYSTNLPVLIEVMETPENISRFLPILRAMMTDGLITLESVQLMKFSDEGSQS